MEKIDYLILFVAIAVGIILIFLNFKIGVSFFLIVLALELSSFLLVTKLRQDFQWLITKQDEYPVIDKNGLKKFIEHGFDRELGWTRKPNTQKDEIGKFGKTSYHIDENGARKNPGHEKLSKHISCFGDSFVFARQVNDDETFEYHLSDLTRTNVTNYGIGNYGLDQALLRLKREYPKLKSKVVIMGVVPSTIVRILCVWKHYNEYGNTFGFKPRYIIVDDKLELVNNFIDSEEKFLNYKDYLPQIQKYDYFYKSKFKKEQIRFPYLLSILKNPYRNLSLIYLISYHKWINKKDKDEPYPAPMKVIMKINLKLRRDLYKKDRYARELFKKILVEFVDYSKQKGFIPVFLFMPQKDDIIYIKKNKDNYYEKFIDSIKDTLPTLDLTPSMLKRDDIDELYSDDNEYGGHYSRFGNEFVARLINDYLKQNKLIKK